MIAGDSSTSKIGNIVGRSRPGLDIVGQVWRDVFRPAAALRGLGAVVLVGLAVAATRELHQFNPEDRFLYVFLLAILASGLLLGAIPALLSAALSVVAVEYFWITPTRNFSVPLEDMPAFSAFVGNIVITLFLVLVFRKSSAAINIIKHALFETRARVERLERHDEVRAAEVGAAGDHIGQLRQRIVELAAYCDRLPLARFADQASRVERLERHDEVRAADVSAAGDHIGQLRQRIGELAAYCDGFPIARFADQASRVERLERHDEVRAADMRGVGDQIGQLRQRIVELTAYCDRFPIAQFADQESRVERLERHDEVRAANMRGVGDQIGQLRQRIVELTAYCDRLPIARFADQASRVERLERHDEVRAADVSSAGEYIGQLRQQFADQESRVERLERHDAVRAADVSAAGEYIGQLRQQFADQASRVERLERHDEVRAAEVSSAGEYIGQLRQQIGDLVAFCDQLGSLPVQHDIAELHRRLARLKDDLQERLLRRDLGADPFRFDLSYSLVALLDRHDRAPLPEPPAPEAKGVSPPEEIGIAALLNEAGGFAEKGDTVGHYACLWQIVVRYPRSPRGWAEYARRFAQGRDWMNCQQAAEHVLNWPTGVDRASVVALLEALETLALNDRLAGLCWQNWLKGLPESLQSHPSAVGLKLWSGEIESAVALLPSVLRSSQPDANGWIVAANLAFEQTRWKDAYQYWRRAFETDLPFALRSAFNEHSARLSIVLRRSGKQDELADWFTEQWAQREAINLIPPTRSPEGEQETRKLRERAMERGLPSVLMAAQPQSANVSVANLFTSGFRLAFATYSLIDTAIVAPWLSDYRRGGACYVTHLMPTERNIALLADSDAPNIIVHIRDPRQAVVSFARHFTRYAFEVAPSSRVHGGGLEEAIARSLDDRIAYIVDWIDGWVGAGERLTVEFTTFEAFVRDREAFVDRLLSLYGGNRRHFDWAQGLREHKGINYHRRVGQVDEWRQILKPEQIERINRAIPDRLWNLFGWEP